MRPETSEEYWSRQPPPEYGKAWPTPQAYSHNADHAPGALKLDHAVWDATGDWATPQAHDRKNAPGAAARGRGGFQSSLAAQVLDGDSGLWPTPICNDGDKDGTNTLARVVQTGSRKGRRDGGERNDPAWPTPKSGDHRSGKASDETLNANSRPLQEQVWEASAKPATTGALNPAFSEWLQGFAPGWTEPDGPPLPHVAHGHQDVPLTYYGGRPAPAGMALLTTVKLNRRNRLKCLGNAVFARCAIMALRALLSDQVYGFAPRDRALAEAG
jgi:hypothetical protein